LQQRPELSGRIHLHSRVQEVLDRIAQHCLYALTIINGSCITFTKKDDHLSISTLFDSLKDIFHSRVSLNILFRIVLTSEQSCLWRMKSFLVSYIPLNATVEMIFTP
jgi:hypothetical protein